MAKDVPLKVMLLLWSFIWIAPVTAFSAYVLGPGDVVRVNVYLFPDLETRSRISETGTIGFPLLGEVKIGGLSEREAEAELATQLKKAKVVQHPQLTVLVEEYHSRVVSLLGNVARPGEYVLEPGKTVIDLLSKAGGPTADAADFVVITRPAAGQSKREVDFRGILEGDTKSEVMVGPGDLVFVPPAPKVFVYGEVNQAGAYNLERDMTVVQAISIAGGISARGTKRGLTVMRTGDNGTNQEISVTLTDRLQPSDVLYVKESLF